MCSRDAPDTDIAGYPAYREAGYRISGIAGYGIPGYYFYLKQKNQIYYLHKPLGIFLAIDNVCTFAFSSRRKFLASVYQDLCGCIRPEIRPFRQTDIRLVWYIQYSDGY